MSRWISDAYIARLLKNNRLLQGNTEYTLWEQEVDRLVDRMPSIDIVRCSECIHNPWNVDSDYTCIWDDDFANREQTPDDFCSYGEKGASDENRR